VIAHELAHMWFGDLVTMAWWDDLWLNEAFATWMASRVLDEVSPEQEEGLSALRGRGWVMDLDAQGAARAIRQPIASGGDVYNAFDGITYTKGAAVLRMLEQWMGPEAFRAGVRDYMAAHAHGSATTADLLTALEARAKKPVGEVAATFLDQPGTPLLTMALQCHSGQVKVDVLQSRYLPAGSTAAQGKPWRVPVCLRYGVDGQAPQRVCFELTERQASWTLPICPRWIHPNADEQGYYLWRLGPLETLALATTWRDQLSMAEKVALAPVLRTQLLAGELGADTWLSTLEALSKEEHWMVLYGVLGGLDALSGAARAQGLRDPYAAYVRRLIAPHLQRVGPSPGKDDALGLRVLRPDLINAMAASQDKKTQRLVQQQAEAFLKNPDAVPFEIGSRALPIWAREGDAKDFERLLVAFRASSDKPALRQALLSALGNFSDPALVRRALDLLLDGTLRAQDFWSVVGPPMREEALHAVVWDWATANYDKLLKLLGDKSARSMPNLAGGFCSAEGRKKAQDFFNSVEKTPGMDRNLALTLERVEQCERLRTLHAERLADFFKKKKK
jgi:alanyl aminopeptidase